MLKAICAGGALLLFSAAGAASETLVERGSYLVNAIMGCDGCHTSRGPAGFNMDKRFAGGSQFWDEPAFAVRGSNITPDRDTGIGSWSEADLKRLMIDGKRPSGVPVAPQMPFAFYKILTPRDLDAVVAYVRTMAPVAHQVAAPVYKQTSKVDLIPGAETPFSDADLKDKAKRGFYLATIAHCMECHARKPDGSFDYMTGLGRGGHDMTGPFGKVTVANITSHPTKGIGGWSDAEIKTALVQGKGRDGRAFKMPMARHIYYSKMTDDDLDAVIAYVRTLPPLE